MKVADLAFTVGGLASSTKGLLDIVRGATPGQTILAGLGSLGQIFGENVNKEIVKVLARTSGQVLSGTVTSVLGGVTMLWDMYQLRAGIQRIVEGGGEEAAAQIRDIARQLEAGLREFSEQQEPGRGHGAETEAGDNLEEMFFIPQDFASREPSTAVSEGDSLPELDRDCIKNDFLELPSLEF